MTTRDEVRRGTSDLQAGAGRSVVTGNPAPGLPQRLYAARERKGVDLNRAERDTKIRAHYLDALERGEWRALPGAVYTKGFLRNYALYLGLDAEEILRDWRHERGDAREAEPIVVPRALIAPRRGFSFTPGVVWAGLLTVGVIAFAAYMGMQVLRFARPPTLSVSDPAVAVSTVDGSMQTYVLRGSSIAGATIAVATPGRDQPYRASAGPDGSWSVEVELRRGRNQFTISAVDPETHKASETVAQRFITVPFLIIEAPTLTVDQPAEGATVENGAIPVQGVAKNAQSVEITAAWLGPTAGQAAPTSPAESASPRPSPSAPAPIVAAVGEDGSFAAPLDLTTGRWTLTVTASSKEGKTTSLSRDVTVGYEGVTLTVTIKGGRAWLKIWVDGVLVEHTQCRGEVCVDGETVSVTGKQSIEVRTGSAGVTWFTLNGTSLGALGDAGDAETWLFEPPKPPRQTERT
jgi:cytoskeletal protein RodZ